MPLNNRLSSLPKHLHKLHKQRFLISINSTLTEYLCFFKMWPPLATKHSKCYF